MRQLYDHLLISRISFLTWSNRWISLTCLNLKSDAFPDWIPENLPTVRKEQVTTSIRTARTNTPYVANIF